MYSQGVVHRIGLGPGDVANLPVPAAGLLHQRVVGVPELVKGTPGAHGRPALAGRAIAPVAGVGVAEAGD